MIEHCISLFKKEQVEKAYRIYVTDCLQAIAENTTHIVGAGGVVDYGKTMKARWIDIIDQKQENTQSADEIIHKLKTGLNKICEVR